MNLNFDIRGYLQPEGIIDLTIEEFEAIFVHQFEESDTRVVLMENYKAYCKDLMQLTGKYFTQWIDGSFISNKDNPRDIDFITFIDSDIYGQYEKEIDGRFSKWSSGNFYRGLDAYTICEYPPKHKFHQTFLADQFYWYEFFSKSRYNRAKKRFSKGFIRINPQ